MTSVYHMINNCSRHSTHTYHKFDNCNCVCGMGETAIEQLESTTCLFRDSEVRHIGCRRDALLFYALSIILPQTTVQHEQMLTHAFQDT